MTQVDSLADSEGKTGEESSTVETVVHQNGMGDQSVAGPSVKELLTPKNPSPGPAGDSKERIVTTGKRSTWAYRTKIPSPRSSPRYKPTVKKFNVFENGDRSGVSTAVLIDFAEMTDWDDFLAELYQGLDFPNHIEAVFTVKGHPLTSLDGLKCLTDIVISHGEPFRLGNYRTPNVVKPLPAALSRSVQLRSTPSSSPVSSARARRTARGNFTKSVFLDNEEEFAANEVNPLIKTFSEQNVSYNHGSASDGDEFSQLPNSTARQALTPKPRPVSCYSPSTVTRIPSAQRNAQPTHIITQSKIPKRVLPVINTPEQRNVTCNYTNPCIELTTFIANAVPSPVKTAAPRPFRPDMTTSLPLFPPNCIPKYRERLSRQEMIARREFVRPRLVTIVRSGMKPRKVSRYLLNQRTARSFEQVLIDITASVKPDWGAIRRVYALSGVEVVTLEDFFKEERIFVVCPNDRVGPDDFQLEDPEVKAIQPFMKIPPSATKGRVLDSRSPQRRPKVCVRATQERTPPVSYPTHPKFIPVIDYPLGILNRYFVGGIIGDGNFAVVRECTHRLNNEKYALKVIDKTKSGRDAPPDHETTILKSVTHPNIIMLYEQFDFTNELYVVMEFVAGGDLFDTIAQSVKFSEAESACMTKDIASALSFLHSRGIVHRDIKPENLLVYVEDDDQRRLKLGDFGLAQVIDDGCPLFTICGTPTYVAPEILAETGYGLKVDVWAMGIILYILLCGYPPFISPTGEQEDLFDLILVGDYEFPMEQWETISEDAKDLIMRMIESDVDLRLEADEVLEHPWLATNAEECDEKRNRFFRKDFKFSVFEQMGLTKLSNTLGPFSTHSDSS